MPSFSLGFQSCITFLLPLSLSYFHSISLSIFHPPSPFLSSPAVVVCGLQWGCVPAGPVPVWAVRSGLRWVLPGKRSLLHLGRTRLQPLHAHRTEVGVTSYICSSKQHLIWLFRISLTSWIFFPLNSSGKTHENNLIRFKPHVLIVWNVVHITSVLWLKFKHFFHLTNTWFLYRWTCFYDISQW